MILIGRSESQDVFAEGVGDDCRKFEVLRDGRGFWRTGETWVPLAERGWQMREFRVTPNEVRHPRQDDGSARLDAEHHDLVPTLAEMAASDDVDLLATQYADAASAHGVATGVGDSDAANSAHDVIAGIYRTLRERGHERHLLPLLEHADPAVAAWAAAHALEFAPEDGERRLTELAQSEDLIGFGAEMTLSEWRAGRLSFP